MAHAVRITIDTAVVAHKALEVLVKSDQGTIGTVLISKGNIEWLPKGNSVNKKRLSWAKFAEFMEEHGKPVRAMRWWIYKCNGRNQPHQRAYGDWHEFFDAGVVDTWGSSDWIPALSKLAPGDMIIAHQSDRNELVGIAKVAQSSAKDTYVYLKPVEKIGVKVRPLKIANKKIATIPSLQPGPINTIYDITNKDAERLVAAARAWKRRASQGPGAHLAAR
jgi:hypothetical protein